MAHTFTNLLSHIIFSTKDRRPFLDRGSRPRVFAYVGGILREIGAVPILINGPEDHIHIFTSLPPSLSMSEVMRVTKANSSKWIRETFPHLAEFAWQTGYAAFSVSQSSAADVERYVANQEEHHRHVSFKEEFISFLKRHSITYDERYIWE